jgi:PTS system galactitol-specific IIC component
MSKRFADREIYIGLDSAVLVGHPVTVSAAIILIPLVLGLAFILPGNKVLPFGDLASLFYFVAFVPFMTKGNLFRSIISGLFIMSVVMYVLTSFGPALTQMAVEVGYEIPAGAVDITGLSAGNWVAWVVYQVARLFTGG